MTTRARASTTLLLLFSLASALFAPFRVVGAGSARAGSDDVDVNAIDGYVTARMRAARIPGLALGIVKGDRIVYLKGYGRADAAGRPVQPLTPFINGSVH